ncbi:hypothetical protein BDF22DRAFT_699625 [Syncephalis plumigaleata]|nr:hypothetical protein BDF22DRAFT_699625 [Syncephalis plumigaleata]
MINEVDIEATEAPANQDVILANHAKLKREEKQFDQQMEEELQARLRERQELQQEITEAKRIKKKQMEETLEALATSEEPAAEVLAKRRDYATTRRANIRSSPLTDRVITAMDVDRQVSLQLDDSEFDPLDHMYAVPFIPTSNYVDPFTHALANNAVAKAGGWSADQVHQRALEEAFSTLFLPPSLASTSLTEDTLISGNNDDMVL